MIFQILGFIAAIFVLVSLSFTWCALAVNNLGEYNIGGVPNSFGTKVFTFIAGTVLAFLWFLLFKNMPFEISFIGK